MHIHGEMEKWRNEHKRGNTCTTSVQVSIGLQNSKNGACGHFFSFLVPLAWIPGSIHC
jgi:hypothetical protein